MAGGVSVWPSRLRSAAALVAVSTSPSGSSPAATRARIASTAAPGLPAAAGSARAASSRSAPDRPATRSAPRSSVIATSAGRFPVRSGRVVVLTMTILAGRRAGSRPPRREIVTKIFGHIRGSGASMG